MLVAVLKTENIAWQIEATDLATTVMGATMSFPSETEIFGEGEAADYSYQIVSGSVRTYKVLSVFMSGSDARGPAFV
jgi:CRP-like cAMP-binding protein